MEEKNSHATPQSARDALEGSRELLRRIERETARLSACGVISTRSESCLAMRGELSALLFRLTNKGYLERITRTGDGEAMRRVRKATPYIDDIGALVDHIDSFVEQNQELMETLAQRGTMSREDFLILFPYLELLVEDNSGEGAPIQFIRHFCENPRQKVLLEDCGEYAVFLYLMLRLKSKSRYYFDYPELAESLLALGESCEKLNGSYRAELFCEVGNYFVSVCHRERAIDSFERACELFLESADVESAAYAAQKAHRINSSLPKRYRRAVDEAEIERVFGEYADVVRRGISGGRLAFDPVELEGRFLKLYIPTLRRVEEVIDREGDLHLPQQRWSILKALLAESGISWRTPQEMNPGVMFD